MDIFKNLSVPKMPNVSLPSLPSFTNPFAAKEEQQQPQQQQQEEGGVNDNSDQSNGNQNNEHEEKYNSSPEGMQDHDQQQSQQQQQQQQPQPQSSQPAALNPPNSLRRSIPLFAVPTTRSLTRANDARDPALPMSETSIMASPNLILPPPAASSTHAQTTSDNNTQSTPPTDPSDPTTSASNVASTPSSSTAPLPTPSVGVASPIPVPADSSVTSPPPRKVLRERGTGIPLQNSKPSTYESIAVPEKIRTNTEPTQSAARNVTTPLSVSSSSTSPSSSTSSNSVSPGPARPPSALHTSLDQFFGSAGVGQIDLKPKSTAPLATTPSASSAPPPPSKAPPPPPGRKPPPSPNAMAAPIRPTTQQTQSQPQPQLVQSSPSHRVVDDEKYSVPVHTASFQSPHPDLGLPEPKPFQPRVIEPTIFRHDQRDSRVHPTNTSSTSSSSSSFDLDHSNLARRAEEILRKQQVQAEELARKQHLLEAAHVEAQVNDFAKKVMEAASKKKQAEAILQATSDARALARVEQEQEKKRKLAGGKESSPTSSVETIPNELASPSKPSTATPTPTPTTVNPSITNPPVPITSPLRSKHEELEIEAAVKATRSETVVSHPFVLSPKAHPPPSTTPGLMVHPAFTPLPPLPSVAPEPAAATPRPEVVIREVERIVEKVVYRDVVKDGPAIPNVHSQLLSSEGSGLLQDSHGHTMREWYGCSCGCGISSLSCNIMNHQTILLSNLQKQYDILQHYVTQLHAGLMVNNISIDTILPCPSNEIRSIIVGSLLTLESSNHNTVRDLSEGIRFVTESCEEVQRWSHTMRHPHRNVVNQPLPISKEHSSYVQTLERQFLKSSNRNQFEKINNKQVNKVPAASNKSSSSSSSSSSNDDDTPDNGLCLNLFTSLPISYDNQSITKTLFNVETLKDGSRTIKMDLPEVIVCELGEMTTRTRSSAISYQRREDVPGLLAPLKADTVAPLGLNRFGGGVRGSLFNRHLDPYALAGGRRDHRTSLSLGALAAGLQRDPSSGIPLSIHDRDPLTTLLHDPIGFELIQRQCEEEHSGENVALWSAVQQYHNELDWVKRIELARTIINRHIARDSPEQINLPSQVTDELVHMLNEVENESALLADGLTTAQSIAQKLLSNDSYKRFLSPTNPYGTKWQQYQLEHPERFPSPSSRR